MTADEAREAESSEGRAADYSADIDKYSGMLAQDPESRAFALLAEAYRKDGQFQEAVKAAEEGLQKHPHYLSGRMALARAYYDGGQKEKSRAEFEKVITAAPDNLMAHRHLAGIYAEEGRLTDAAKSLKMIVLLDPNDESARRQLRDIAPGEVGPAGMPAAGPGMHIEGHRYEEAAAGQVAEETPVEFEPMTDQEMLHRPDLIAREETPEAGEVPPETEEGREETAEAPPFMSETPAAGESMEPSFDLAPEEAPATEVQFEPQDVIEEAPTFTAEPFEPPPVEAVPEAPVMEPVMEAHPEPEATPFEYQDIFEEPPPVEATPEAPVEPVMEAHPEPEAAPFEYQDVFEEPPPVEAVPEAPVEPVVEFVPEPAASFLEPQAVIEEPPPVEAVPEAPVEPVVEEAADIFREPEKHQDELNTETLAEIYIQQGFYDKALVIYRKILATRPDDAGLKQKCRELENLVNVSQEKDAQESRPSDLGAVGEGTDAGGDEEALNTLRRWLGRLKTEKP